MTKRIRFYVFIFLAPSLFAAPPNVKISPLKYEIPQAERVVLDNGLVVYLLESHELPLVNISLRLKSNPSYEVVPDAFELMGDCWRTGGTKNITPADFDQKLEDMATDLSVSVDHESSVLSLTSITKNSSESLDLFFSLLLEPRFADERISLVKEKQYEALRRKNETPGDIGRRAFRDALYGPMHVYAQNPTSQTVRAIKREHFFRIHKMLAVPQGAILTVSGDVNKEFFLAALRKRLLNWPSTQRPVPAYDFSLRAPLSGNLFYLEKNFTQSRIIFGRVGPSRHHPDQYALKIADTILGGGGPSRLFGEIRSRLGLAYVVGSFWVEREGPGMMGVVCETMAPATLQAARAIRQELQKFHSAPPLQEELDMAKDATINSFLFNFDSPDSVVANLSSVEFFGYPSDHLETYTQKISRLTREDIFHVAKKYYSPGDMKTIIVGNKAAFKEPLESLGEVVSIPLETLD